MQQSERTRARLLAHFKRYPRLQIRDVFKYIYQSACGCEHMVSSPSAAIAYVQKEYAAAPVEREDSIETLDGAYSCVHLSYLRCGLRAETLGKLFFLSAKKEEGGVAEIEKRLDVARGLVCDGLLPFSPSDFDCEVERWRALGYPAVHHSDIFREEYKPSYRVISNELVPLLPLFARLDVALEAGDATVAIDGGSASGKTTLAALLQKVYDCNVFHIDDFFLRPEQRVAARFAEVGGNVDRERFLEEVLLPLKGGAPIVYRRFDCASSALSEPICIPKKPLTVIEGVYSMHPALAPHYDLSVFLDISPALQEKRIAHRNSPQMAKRYFEEWIPLENVYFEKAEVRQRCDIRIPADVSE